MKINKFNESVGKRSIYQLYFDDEEERFAMAYFDKKEDAELAKYKYLIDNNGDYDSETTEFIFDDIEEIKEREWTLTINEISINEFETNHNVTDEDVKRYLEAKRKLNTEERFDL